MSLAALRPGTLVSLSRKTKAIVLEDISACDIKTMI